MNQPVKTSIYARGNHEDLGRSYLDPEEHSMATEQSKEFFHAPSSLQTYLLTVFLKKMHDAGKNVMSHVKEKMWIRDDNVQPVMDMLAVKYGFKYLPAGHKILFYKDEAMVMLRWTSGGGFDKVTVYCEERAEALRIREDVLSFDANVRKLAFHWIVNTQGESVDVVEEWEEHVAQDLYPFINDFDTYAERFQASRSNILILIGEPGTGKTTFIKHLIDASQRQAYVTYDENVLNSDSSFADFISDDSAGQYVVEDADNFLRSRADGNNMISRFLNIGDGLIKLKNKKLIFSTNLPSVRDIDPALIRPGRCFDVLQFRRLNAEEAQAAATARNLQLVGDQKEYTLAEIFNSPVAKPKSSVGFY